MDLLVKVQFLIVQKAQPLLQLNVYARCDQVQQFLDKTKIIKVPDYSTPIINGTEAAKILGVKPGQAINTFLELINHWRDENPDLTKEDIINYTNEKRGFNKKFIEQIKNDKL